MNSKTYYLIIFLVLITAVVLVVIFTGDDEPTNIANLPPGHPNIGEMGDQGPPDKTNVRAEFMHKLTELKKKVDAQKETDTTDVLTLARMMFDSHQAAGSIAYFERYVKLAPKNTDAKIDLSVAYYDQKRLDDAFNITQEVLGMEPDNTTAHYNLGVLYIAKEQKDKAKDQLNKLIKKYPESQDAKRAQELLKQM